MASSSSSVSQSFSYDVFLSFRGEDTRKNFVDHLYKDLEQKGIHTYKDDETLGRGESVRPALLKAIKESEIVVVVFSKNYADSSWCLDELAYIIECMETSKKIVMPVFYKIDPSNVRKLDGEFGKAFGKHESHHKVEVWRGALIKSGNLSGWVTNDFANGHEAECIENIVGTISGRLSQLETSVTKDLVGIDTRLQDLKLKLDIGSGGVKMVGVWGVGGGGKTTLASAAYMEISHQFDGHCLLQNIREESRKNGLESLQEKVLLHILGTKVVVRSEIEGRNMIKSRLCHKSVLVVLDDVDDLKQLEALAGSHNWFGDGSRIIITTRDKHLLSRKANVIYEVSLLSHDEAIKLFDRHAKSENIPIEDYEKLSLHIVSYAGGLPLALEIIGSFLYDKDKDEWKSVLAKSKCMPNVKVTERLQISYNGLEPDEKELFLDIACFLRGWPIDRAMKLLDASSFHRVKVLVQKSLIKISNGKFEMHDLIEEMAHYIVSGEHPNDPEKHSRIWQEKDIVKLCAMGPVEMLMENNHIEVFALPIYLHGPNSPSVDADRLSFLFGAPTISLPRYADHPSLPDIVANMKKLRWIYWEGYPASSLPAHFQPTKLGCLILRGGQQKQLWQGRKDLPNLKFLDLTYSPHLIWTPDFNGLPCLETLILENCKKLTEIHPSIGYHERLVLVNMRECYSLKTFPPIMHMKSLETLDLSSCPRLQKFPDIQTSLDSLANLHLSSTGIEIIPSSVGLFCTNLVSFRLSHSNLMRTPDFNSLPCLETLILEYCKKLTEIHPSIGYHERLVLVNMKECSELKTFPPILRMKSLETLDLSFCLKLQKFPDIQTSLDNLANLHLDRTDIEIIPSSVGQFCTNLVSFDLSYCRNLQRIKGNFRLLKSLKVFHLIGCRRLEKLAWDFFDKECCLEVLSLSTSTQLAWDLNPSPSYQKKLPQFQRCLIKLDLRYCGLEDGDIPYDICELLNLQVLNLTANKFSRLPSSLSQIPSLKLLDLSKCKSLVELTDLPSSIAILNADYCYSLERIGDLSNCKWLWKVSLEGSDKLIGRNRVLHSMLQVNTVEDRFMSVHLPRVPLSPYTLSNDTRTTITLQLPHNWYSDYSGFLLHTSYMGFVIVFKQGMPMSCSWLHYQPGHSEEFDKNPESYDQYERVGYVPFGSLRHASWWNPTCTNISLEIHDVVSPKVVFVRRESKIGDSKERAIDCSEFWDKENEDSKTFEITDDPKSSKLKIVWCGDSLLMGLW